MDELNEKIIHDQSITSEREINELRIQTDDLETDDFNFQKLDQ